MIGISSPAFSLRPLPQMMEEISKHFKLWEIVAEAEHSIVDKKKMMKELLASYKLEIQIHAPISDLNIGSLVPSMKEAAFQSLWETMDAAHDLGINRITLHPGYLSALGFYAPEKAKEACRKSLLDLDKVNRTYGLELCLENMPSIRVMTCMTPEDIEFYTADTDIAFCLDVGHANTTNNLEEYARLKKHIKNVHIHDNKGKEDQHLVVGDGNVDWNRVKKLLSGYKNNMVIESRNLEEGIRSRKKLEKIVGLFP